MPTIPVIKMGPLRRGSQLCFCELAWPGSEPGAAYTAWPVLLGATYWLSSAQSPEASRDPAHTHRPVAESEGQPRKESKVTSCQTSGQCDVKLLASS